ncbi:MAG: hypothetical protein F6K30_16020 [Cyanothece sp. SIO2G6]|nr:hypothetical protein [Cyanothece sp. SIO2G6]
MPVISLNLHDMRLWDEMGRSLLEVDWIMRGAIAPNDTTTSPEQDLIEPPRQSDRLGKTAAIAVNHELEW